MTINLSIVESNVLVSNTAEAFTSLFNIFNILAVIVGAVVLGLMLFLIVKYRDTGDTPEPEDAPKLGKLQPERGHAKSLTISLTLSTIVLSVLVLGTFGALDTILNAPDEEGALDVTVTAFQWGWRFEYDNGYVNTGELRVPVGEVVRLNVNSDDVFHNFGIIQYKIKIDAIPGRTNHIWFVAEQPGEFNIQCFELCGIGHAFMKAKLIAMEPSSFENWYKNTGNET